MKKKMTPAATNKLIKKLCAEKDYLLNLESQASVAYEIDGKVGERPQYDFVAMNDKIDAIDDKVATLRHAINVFNTRTKLKDSEFTLDEALVRMAQLNAKKQKLDTMRKRLPRQKSNSYTARSYVEYIVTNYDLESVKEEYAIVEDTIADLQIKIDYINQTKLIEVEI